jgi:protein subunit release factor B
MYSVRPTPIVSVAAKGKSTGVASASFFLLPFAFLVDDSNRYMSAFPVSPEKEAQLARRMAGLGVSEADIEESFVRSGGHGGQNVNKTSTCVMLVHRPTGLQVKCQATRQQGLNRFIARRLLLDKIEEQRNGFIAAKRAEIERIRRQKRKRSRRAKDKMLANKAHQSEKKDFRRRIEA